MAKSYAYAPELRLQSTRSYLDGLSGQTPLFLLCFAFDVDKIKTPIRGAQIWH